MSNRIAQLGRTVVCQPNRHTASVIFMHGSGGTGVIAKQSLNMVLGRSFSFPHIRVVYPTAPLRPYSLCDGDLVHVWFDRHELSQSVPEDLTSIEPIAEEVSQLVDQEVSRGVDVKRIFLGGFSMGGSLALQMGYRFRPDIGGIFVCSSFLNHGSKVYEVLESSPETRRPPLFMSHGEEDEMVPLEWGRHTFKQLQQRGVSGELHSFPKLDHSINIKELTLLQDWLLKNLPDV